MIKFGVTRRDGFARYALDQERRHRGWWPFAYTLLEGPASDDVEFEQALVTRLYESLLAGDGVYKITRRDRFAVLDQEVVAECRKRFEEVRPLVIHDIAASNGITSLDLYRLLTQERPVVFHASDYFDRLYLVTPLGSRWTVAFDADGQPLQLSSDRFVVSAYRKEPLRFPVNRLIQACLLRSALPAAVEQFRRFRAEQTTPGVRALRLFHAECLKEADRPGSSFFLQRHDGFAPNPYSCHVVRIMNFLTSRHVPREQIPVGVRAACHGLVDGGLLILGRTVDEDDGRIRATVFERRGSALCRCWSMTDGYEHEDLVLETRLDGTRR